MQHMSRFQMSWKCVIIFICLFDEHNLKNILGHGSGRNQQERGVAYVLYVLNLYKVKFKSVSSVGVTSVVMRRGIVLEHDKSVCARRLILLYKILPAF